MKLDDTCDFGIFASPLPTTPSGAKRTYARKVKTYTPAVPTGGFTTRLPGPVNVTVKANPHDSISDERDLSVDADQERENLEGSGESGTFTFTDTEEELGWLEDIGHPGEIDITHPSLALMFGDTLARADMSLEEFTEILPVLPSDPDEYFENLHLALTYEAMNRITEEVAAMMNGTAAVSSMGLDPMSLIHVESDESSRSSSPIVVKTVLKGGYGTEVESERNAEALTKLRIIAQVELVLVKNRAGKRAPLVFKPHRPVQFLKIGSKNLSEVIGLQMGTYVQRSDVRGNPDSGVDYFAVLSALLHSSNLPPAIMKDQKCRIETHFTSEPIESPERDTSPNKRSRKKLKLSTILPEEEQDANITNENDCPDVIPLVPETISIKAEKLTEEGIFSLSEENDSKCSTDFSSKVSENGILCEHNESKRSDDSSFELDSMPRLCRVEDLWNLEAKVEESEDH